MDVVSTHFSSIADKYINVRSIDIAYRDEGAGQIILCLHAIGHSSKDFISLYNLPLDKYRIIAIDFPSHGASGVTKEDASSTYYSQVIRDFIKQQNLNDIVIVGNSIGGATAIRVASGNSSVKMLSLSNSAGLDKGGFMASLFLRYMVRFFRKGVDRKPEFQEQFERYYRKVLPSETATYRRNEITKDAYKLAPLLVQSWTSFQLKYEDLRPIIKTIDCPVLFTWGMKDKYVQFGRHQEAIKMFKKYRLIKYDVGHTPYIECPDMFLKDFKDYFEEQK